MRFHSVRKRPCTSGNTLSRTPIPPRVKLPLRTPRANPLNQRTLSLPDAVQRFARAHRGAQRLAFTNGCFDFLHPGHIHTLEASRALGDALIVGLNSDASVRQLKGPGRPLVPEQERAELLAALECVDAVVIYNEPTPRETIAALLPDVLVKGGDWPDDQIVGREEVEVAGGRVVSVPVLPAYSTTAILQTIRNLRPAPPAGS
jgi:D-glycero-beta-D-manno-heptose 1-phosphate adenylyltransferase